MHYVYGKGGLLYGEYDGYGQLIREYIYLNDEPIAQINADESITYLHTDHLGTPRKGSNSAGSQVWSWDSDAFGNGAPSGTATVNLRFAGQYYDTESGLHYNWNRYYDPSTGRYISSDPIGLAGGLNTFAYVNANPVMFVDPEGLTSMDVTGGMNYGSSSYGPREVAEWCRLNPFLCVRYGGAAGVAGVYLGCVAAGSEAIGKAIGDILNNSVPDANEKDGNAMGYYPPPAVLPAFPDATRVKDKNGRRRWKDKKGNIYEWDSQHGKVEVYDKTGKKHKGEYDPNTGEQTKPPEKGRTTEK